MTCINPMSNEEQYVKWMEDMRTFKIDEGVESDELKALYRAAEKFLGEGSKVRYQKKENQIISQKANIQSFALNGKIYIKSVKSTIKQKMLNGVKTREFCTLQLMKMI